MWFEASGDGGAAGAVTYDLLSASTETLRERMKAFGGLLERLESNTNWELNFPFYRPANCFHGGAFFEAVGEDFASLERSREIVNADVLDAWFPPSPKVVEALQAYLPWLLRTSPPTACGGLIGAIARARGVEPHNILPGAGLSTCIFRALRSWLSEDSHALILDPDVWGIRARPGTGDRLHDGPAHVICGGSLYRESGTPESGMLRRV